MTARGPEPLPLDKRSLRLSFERAAATYDRAAVLQRTVAGQLVERLTVARIAPRAILDIGCGTGYVGTLLARRFGRARILGLDIAAAMVGRARRRAGLFAFRRRFVCADAEALPLPAAAFDLVVSNLTLQWCDAARVFAEVRRVLRPGGLFVFATFGPDTLGELRAAWRAVDGQPHVHSFADMHDLGDLLMHAGFADPVLDVERFTLTYADVGGVLRDLKQIGAHNAAAGRARGLTGRNRFARFREAYEAMRTSGHIPASYEVVYALAWLPETVPVTAGGETHIPLERVRRRR